MMCSFFVRRIAMCVLIYIKILCCMIMRKKKEGKAPLAEESDLNVVVKMMLKKFVGDLDCCYS